MEPLDQPDENWRELMTREDRIKVCQHIMAKLTACYHPTVPEHSLREKTSAFESQAYTKGINRRDYLRRIAAGLSNVERQVAGHKKQAALAQQRGAGSSGTQNTNPMQQMHAAAAARQLPTQQATAAHQLQQQQQQMLSMVSPINMQHIHNQMMQQQQGSKQNAPPPGFQNAQMAADAKASNSRAQINSGSIASAAALVRSKAQSQSMGENPIGESDIARLDSFNQAGQASHLGTELNRELLMGVNAQNAESRQNALRQQTLQAAALNANQAQSLKQGSPSEQANASGIADFFTGDPNRKLTPEQINHLLTMNAQGGLAPGVSAALPPGMNAASLALGQMGSRGMNVQMLQQIRQNAAMQAAQANASAGNASYVDRATRAATGMSVSQMSAYMAQSTQNNEKIRMTQDQYGNLDRSRLAAAQAAANQRRGHQARPSAAGSEEFWVKLEGMKRKYGEPLNKLLPYITKIANGQRADKREQFRKHITDCFAILRLTRGSEVPHSLNTALLDKASKFIDSVIEVIRNARSAPSGQAQQAAQQASQQAVQQAGKMTASQYTMAQNLATQQRQGAGSHAAHAHREMQIKLQQQRQQQLRQQQQSNAALASAGRQFPDASKAGAKSPAAGMPSYSQQSGNGRQSPKKLNASLAAQLSMAPKTDQFQLARNAAARAGIPSAALIEDQSAALHRNAMLQVRAQQANQQMPRALAQQAAAHQAAVDTKAASQQAVVSANANRMMINAQLQKQLHMKNSRSQNLIMAGHRGVKAPAKAAEVQVKSETRSAGPNKESTAPGTAGLTRAPMNLSHSVQYMEAKMKKISEQTLRWEQLLNSEWKRGKAERIQDTLTALRNNNRPYETANGKGQDRPTSLVHVDNCTEGDEVIRSNTVFECSSEQGLRLAKRPKNETAEIKSAREAVEADCKAAEEKNPILALNILEEFGQPVVECMLLIEEIKLPKLTVRVQRGYPRKGGTSYSLSLPPLGWTGMLALIRDGFRRSLANAPTTSIGVATVLDAWACEAEAVVEAELRCSSSGDEGEVAA